MLKRKLVMVPAAMTATLALAAAAPASTSHGATIKQRSTDRGDLLVNRKGHLLYVFAPDKRNKDVCVKKLACTSVWPPVTTKRKPVAGPGIKASKLGTIKLPGGSKQVTYFGHPLYGYTADIGHGNTSYIGINSTGGRWWGITPAGKIVK
jgi:predicted lipoprotein with Yx(FWY)xxD motif